MISKEGLTVAVGVVFFSQACMSITIPQAIMNSLIRVVLNINCFFMHFFIMKLKVSYILHFQLTAICSQLACLVYFFWSPIFLCPAIFSLYSLMNAETSSKSFLVKGFDFIQSIFSNTGCISFFHVQNICIRVNSVLFSDHHLVIGK